MLKASASARRLLTPRAPSYRAWPHCVHHTTTTPSHAHNCACRSANASTAPPSISEVFTLDCAGNAHMFVGAPLETHLSLSAVKFVANEVFDALVRRAQCAWCVCMGSCVLAVGGGGVGVRLEMDEGVVCDTYYVCSLLPRLLMSRRPLLPPSLTDPGPEAAPK